MTPPLLTLDEVADRLAVSRRTVADLVARGEIAVHRIGRSVRVSEQGLAAYLRRTEVPATAGQGGQVQRFTATGYLGDGPDPLAHLKP